MRTNNYKKDYNSLVKSTEKLQNMKTELHFFHKKLND